MLKVRLLAKYIFLFQAYSSLGQDGPTSDLFQSETVLNVAKSIDRTIPQVYSLFIKISNDIFFCVFRKS